jgi:hypothetical protein
MGVGWLSNRSPRTGRFLVVWDVGIGIREGGNEVDVRFDGIYELPGVGTGIAEDVDIVDGMGSELLDGEQLLMLMNTCQIDVVARSCRKRCVSTCSSLSSSFS